MLNSINWKAIFKGFAWLICFKSLTVNPVAGSAKSESGLQHLAEHVTSLPGSDGLPSKSHFPERINECDESFWALQTS